MTAEAEWEEIIEQLAEKRGIVLIVGAADTGKTTFTLALARAAVEKGRRVAIIDADLGQSTVGPPTTVGLTVLSDLHSLEEMPVKSLYFVGDTSPFGHILQSVVGTKKLTDESGKFKPDLVIIDTSGLVTGPLGQALKYYKAQAINPDYIVILEREDELDEMVSFLKKSGRWEIVSLTTPTIAQRISPGTRADLRREKFRHYFVGSSVRRISLKDISLYPPLPDFLQRGDLLGILVSLKDDEGKVLGIGILENLLPRQGVFEVFTPVSKEADIRGVELGFLKIDRDGNELGRAHHK